MPSLHAKETVGEHGKHGEHGEQSDCKVSWRTKSLSKQLRLESASIEKGSKRILCANLIQQRIMMLG